MKTIYIVENNLNGKVYVGQTKNPNKRKSQHFNSINRKEGDKRKDYPLYQDMIKYGVENFSFKEIEKTEDDKANEREVFYIEKFAKGKGVYNLVCAPFPMSDSDFVEKRFTKEERKRYSERMKKRNEENWKKESYRKEMSEQSSRVQKERLKDKDYLEKKTNDLKKHWEKKKKTVGQYTLDGELIKTFKGLRVAERELGIHIHGHIKNPDKRKQAGGFIFKYLD
jgi:group I intron endonuclease